MLHISCLDDVIQDAEKSNANNLISLEVGDNIDDGSSSDPPTQDTLLSKEANHSNVQDAKHEKTTLTIK